ncbi:ubiquitin-conjugating enzyme E2 S [Eurytemora carolleeae]|uniref:ubiquitin-conjugating enzyme E2 S n=1 Tax=Eurytemora carolleeae TaxID=1294199 RepID=UPI000C76EA86|nr:ubiquitin-conjugating enzyme E2 S [Eurytemora carolleeae]|eukprot:XP_023322425.1 ubiquitin-conjugating enzyme E2 S-like [Eurytemora affinis]
MMSSNMENVAPNVLRTVLKQAQALVQEKMEGIHVLLNDDDMTDIQAVLDGPPGTPYTGGCFRVKIVLSKDYPATPPKGFFLTKIFHPNVGPQGEICVNTLKKDWKPDLGIKHILLTIKCLLIVPNPESALNEEAGKLLLEQYDSYCERARLYTDIHAKPSKSSSSSENRKRGDLSEPSSETDKKEKKGKLMTKDKKRTLKRL